MSESAGLFRRIAPAVLITTTTIALVGLFDPAFGDDDGGDTIALPARPSDSATSESGPAPDSKSTDPESATSDPTASDPTTSGPASCDQGQTVTGDSVDTRWGPVQVEAVVSGGQLCSVYAIDYPYGDRKSARISDQVIPYLDEVAVTMSTEFDAVSGATYTSEAYRDSLQSILDRL